MESLWGTWEELLLGGAVLRHGTLDWHVVAAELRARSVSPDAFTPEDCKAKYEDLQARYSGCTAWFEELRKKRVAELKRALEVSEDSIGSLESKLESLKSENKDEEKVGEDCETPLRKLEPQLPVPKLERMESSTKETTSSKDGLSAGSFTHETRTNWSSPPCDQDDMDDTKLEASYSCDEKALTVVDRLVRGCTVKKKRRGKRKRKDCSRSCNNGKETSVGDSEFVLDSLSVGGVVVSGCKENSTTDNNGALEDHQSRSFRKDGVECLMEILDSVLENKAASAFRRRLDSQKRGRYKKMIRRHMDMDTIRSRISSKTIKSTKELFRDLLVLTNNALAFYSKTTREYKSALLLRDHVSKKLRSSSLPTNATTTVDDDKNNKNVSDRKLAAAASNNNNNNNASVKPRSMRPGNRKIVAAKVDGGGSINLGSKKSTATKVNSADSPTLPPPVLSSSPPPRLAESSPAKKKGIGRPRRVGRGSGGQAPKRRVRGK